MILTLYNGYSYNEIDEKNVSTSYKKYPFRKDYFKEMQRVISLSGSDLERSKDDLFKFNSSTQKVKRLLQLIDSLSNNNFIKRDGYFREFNTTRIYSERNFYQPGVTATDSSAIALQPLFEPWVIFDSLPVAQRKEAVIKAIENLKFGSSYLVQKEEYIHNEIKNIRGYQIDLHKKFTMAFACIVFFMIGAPLGAIIRKGGLGTPAVISVLFFVVYYVLSISFEKMVKEDLINSIIGMWAPCLILLPIGIFLTYKATTDSSLFNVETYMHFLTRIKDFIYRLVFNIKNENPSPRE